MIKTTFLTTVLVVAIVSIGATLALLPPQNSDAAVTGESVSVTVDLSKTKLKPGEVIVLLDTTGSGTLSVVHVATNLPCKGSSGPNADGGNDTPDVFVVAGVAGGAVGTVIESADDDTGFVGPKKTCVFHDTSPALPFPGVSSIDLTPATVTSITDVILINLGSKKVSFPEGTTVTITGTYV